MVGFGWFLSIVGGILCAIGLYVDNTASNDDYGFGVYTRSDDIKDAETCLIIGIILLAIGVILLVAGYIRQSIEKRQWLEKCYMNRALEKMGGASILHTRRCTNCGCIGQEEDAFCPKCGKKYKEQDKSSQA